LMWDLYQYYAEELYLGETFNPAELLRGQRQQAEFDVAGGMIESEYGQDCFIFSGVVKKQDFPNAGQTTVNILKQGWKTII